VSEAEKKLEHLEGKAEEPAAASKPPPPTPDEIFAELTTNVRKYLPTQDISILDRAYKFGANKHSAQARKSGEPYITHPLSVASILSKFKLDLASLAAAILHDTVEDTETTLAEVEQNFGKDVAELVDGMTKIGKIEFRSNQERLAENFRKMVFAMARDLRVILIKLADRLHNMRTINALPGPKRRRIAQETMDIYAPLANRLGIYGIKSELEDLCLRQLKSDVYKDLKSRVSAKKAERLAYINDVKTILENELHKYGFKNAVVYGRPKHFYSIYKKMVERRIEFDDIHDLFAFRIIVDSVKDCYEALGIVHAMWKPMPGRFKDYIAMPKANMYQSLHTTVVRPNGEPAEIQIRTHEMHEICEYGVAAHWAYKEKSGERPGVPAQGSTDLKKFSWLRQIMEWQTELKDPDEFLEAVKVDLFEEEIFVFTPKGDVIQLPIGATALDFAFAVHTQIGVTTVGTKVNGKIAPLKKALTSGDIIEILTSPNQKPSKDWLNFVTTSKAKNKIRAYLRSEQRARSRDIGRGLMCEELELRGQDAEKLLKSGADSIARAAKESSVDDALAAVGYGKLDAKELVDRAFPQLERAHAEDKPLEIKPAATRSTNGILVSGIDNVLVNFGRCCNPLPGEDIQGFITRGRGVTIHRSSCSRALDLDPQRRVPVSWATAEAAQGDHFAFIKVIVHDRPGVLAEVTSVISACGANIQKAQVQVGQDLMGHLDFELTIKSLTQLQSIIRKVESIPAVVSVERRSTSRAGRA
jgi:guanosine-3',5'-bis(diphosphate) 3'-pyrophosphohydrolase